MASAKGDIDMGGSYGWDVEFVIVLVGLFYLMLIVTAIIEVWLKARNKYK